MLNLARQVALCAFEAAVIAAVGVVWIGWWVGLP